MQLCRAAPACARNAAHLHKTDSAERYNGQCPNHQARPCSSPAGGGPHALAPPASTLSLSQRRQAGRAPAGLVRRAVGKAVGEAGLVDEVWCQHVGQSQVSSSPRHFQVAQASPAMMPASSRRGVGARFVSDWQPRLAAEARPCSGCQPLPAAAAAIDLSARPPTRPPRASAAPLQ